MSNTYQTVLICPKCGTRNVIYRKTGKEKSTGHKKNYTCPTCKTYQTHLEISNYEVYNFKKRTGEIYSLKLYENQGRIPFQLEVDRPDFGRWRNFQEVFQPILQTSDYNLEEILLLNYLDTEGDFKEEILKYNFPTSPVLEPVVLELRVSKFLSDLFIEDCKTMNKDPKYIFKTILKFLVSNETELATGLERKGI